MIAFFILAALVFIIGEYLRSCVKEKHIYLLGLYVGMLAQTIIHLALQWR
jgi:hypothetical protein